MRWLNEGTKQRQKWFIINPFYGKHNHWAIIIYYLQSPQKAVCCWNVGMIEIWGKEFRPRRWRVTAKRAEEISKTHFASQFCPCLLNLGLEKFFVSFPQHPSAPLMRSFKDITRLYWFLLLRVIIWRTKRTNLKEMVEGRKLQGVGKKAKKFFFPTALSITEALFLTFKASTRNDNPENKIR